MTRWEADDEPAGYRRDGVDPRAADPPRTGHWDDDELTPTDGSPGVVGTPGWLDDGDGRGRNRLLPDRFRHTRLDPGRRGALALGVIGLVAVVLTGVMVMRDRPVSQAVPPVPALRAEHLGSRAEQTAVVAATSVGDDEAGAGSGSGSGELVVSVVGLVHRAGLHRLPGGARVADAIEMAGGVREGADLAGLNLAQRLTDGDQVLVGAAGPQAGQPVQGSAMISAAGGPPGANPSSAGGGSGPGAAGGTARIDLNSATEAELDALPGVGPVTAKAIITWRTTNGPFTDVAQLGEVNGIGPARLARLRDLVTT
ncbi:competence protein ComEA [Nocardia caishijiensis]|uniref:Competence protein ComEA n=2 Tax=Nocardia caishijiensis TaxID=184756 RepID=A0ABQ6YJ58_9NOCA|nr:competence protein ComEA [Nocardia caishijiensis]